MSLSEDEKRIVALLSERVAWYAMRARKTTDPYAAERRAFAAEAIDHAIVLIERGEHRRET